MSYIYGVKIIPMKRPNEDYRDRYGGRYEDRHEGRYGGKGAEIRKAKIPTREEEREELRRFLTEILKLVRESREMIERVEKLLGKGSI